MSRYVGSIIASILLTLIVSDDAGGTGTMLALSTLALGASLLTALTPAPTFRSSRSRPCPSAEPAPSPHPQQITAACHNTGFFQRLR